MSDIKFHPGNIMPNIIEAVNNVKNGNSHAHYTIKLSYEMTQSG